MIVGLEVVGVQLGGLVLAVGANDGRLVGAMDDGINVGVPVGSTDGVLVGDVVGFIDGV